MTHTHSAAGRPRRVFVPPPTGFVPLGLAQLPDPPIYRDLMRAWADRGRTLPGRHDPEWVRLAAPLRGLGQFNGSRDPRAGGSREQRVSGSRDPRGDGR